ncbi:AAA domain-containing protein [Bosea sp. AK1]|uniref:AAA family ATPase n=1 Tax=Bosea sp. AK1 TaxID=2587160 RepID=UPI0011532CF1|nr:AAA family ATPase [Bosea sp. AK1]TQI75328.1 AAA domain-containing protein [Bosea sp. AK1]
MTKPAIPPAKPGSYMAHAVALGYGDFITPVQKPKPDPVNPGAYLNGSGKAPALRGWPDTVLSPEQAVAHDRKRDSVGLVARNANDGSFALGYVDADEDDQRASDALLGEIVRWCREQGFTSIYIRRAGKLPRFALPLRTPKESSAKPPDRGRCQFGFARSQLAVLGQHPNGEWRTWYRIDTATGACETMLSMPACAHLPLLTVAQYDALMALCGPLKEAEKRADAPPRPAANGARIVAPAGQKHAGRPEAVRLILQHLPNDETDYNKAFGYMATIIGTVRDWPEDEACDVAMGFYAKYPRHDPVKDRKVFEQLWAKRDTLVQSYPDLLNWARAGLGGDDGLRAIGLTVDDRLIPGAFGHETVAEDDDHLNWKARFAEAMRALGDARTEPGQISAKARQRRLVDLAMPTGLPQVPPEITDWHVRGVTGMLVSDPGVGKTTRVIATALAIAHERPELIGSQIMDWAGAVVLVLNETSPDTALAMLDAAEAHFGLMPSDRKHPVIVYPEPVKLLAKADNRAGPATTQAATLLVERLAELRRGHPLALVVFDTLAAVLSGLEENSATDMQAAMDFMSTLAKAGHCAVEVVHHTRKAPPGRQPSAADARGSSALRGAARCITALTLASAEDQRRYTEETILKLSCEKRNDAPQPSSIYLARLPVPVAVRDPRDAPGTQRTRDYPVLCPGTLVSPFASQRDAQAAYTALQAVQATGMKLREAGKPDGDGWVRASTAIAGSLNISEREARLLLTELSDREWIVSETVIVQRWDERGRKNGSHRHDEYRLVRPEVA